MCPVVSLSIRTVCAASAEAGTPSVLHTLPSASGVSLGVQEKPV